MASGYRDDLEAAHRRVVALERRLAEEETANADLQRELEQLRAQLAGDASAAPSDSTPSTSPEQKRPWHLWPRRIGLLAALMLVCSVGGPTCGLCAASCEGYRQTLDESLATCPAVKKLLGDDPALSHVGLACGSTKSGGGAGTASWNLPVSGSRARGTLSVSLEKHGGQWAMTRGKLFCRGDSVDLVQCARRMKDPDAMRGAMYDRLRGQCDSGNATACVTLGAIYERGEGVARDLKQAARLYARACARGFAPACRMHEALQHPEAAPEKGTKR